MAVGMAHTAPKTDTRTLAVTHARLSHTCTHKIDLQPSTQTLVPRRAHGPHEPTAQSKYCTMHLGVPYTLALLSYTNVGT